MFDSQQIEKAALEEVLRQMAATVMIVKAPSGVNVLQNSQTQQMSERYLGCSVLKGVEDLRDLHDRGVFELVRPDGRVYEFEEWPIMRSLTSGEEVVEELLQRMADGTQLWLRCNSSPIYDDEGRIVAGALVVHDITEQKRTEEALREASRRIENSMESITEAFLALDREWRISYLNGQTLRRFRQAKGEELTREGLIGKNNWEVFPDAVGTMVYDKYHEAMRERKPVHFETYYPPTNAWYEANIYPSEEGLAIYSPDITERKRAEKELRESEERFRSTFEQAAVGIGHVDLEGHFLRLNQKFCEIVDYEQEELLQLSFQDITHPEDLERDLEEFRQLLAGEIETYSIEKRYIRKDSSIVWVKLTVSVVWAASGEPSYIVGVIEDITERKRAEEELKESSRRTENILESITDEFFAVDREWRFTYVNERALRSIHTLKGDEELTREELLGKNLWEVVPEVVGSVFDHKYHEAMGEQEPVEFEAYSPWSNRWGEVRACPSEEGLLVYARDITERKRAEQEIVMSRA